MIVSLQCIEVLQLSHRKPGAANGRRSPANLTASRDRIPRNRSGGPADAPTDQGTIQAQDGSGGRSPSPPESLRQRSGNGHNRHNANGERRRHHGGHRPSLEIHAGDHHAETPHDGNERGNRGQERNPANRHPERPTNPPLCPRVLSPPPYERRNRVNNLETPHTTPNNVGAPTPT